MHGTILKIIQERKLYIEKCNFNLKNQDLKLSVGIPVVAHTTNKKLNILNSEKFVVSQVNN